MNTRILFVSLLFSIMMSCEGERDNVCVYLDYRAKVDSLLEVGHSIDKQSMNADLCKFFNLSDWDSLMIIRPYLPEKNLDKIDFGTASEARDSMEYVIGVEWAQGLLFFKSNELVNYSVIGGIPSFSQIDALTPMSMPILLKSNCRVVLANTSGSKKDFFFFPLGFTTTPIIDENSDEE